MSKRVLWGLAAGTLVWAAGCATTPELKPAPAAQAVDSTAAFETEAGVRMVVDGGAWDGVPAELETVVPVKVRIENQSGAPLALRYGKFSLRTPDGTELTAIPPMQIEGTEMAGGVGGVGFGPIAPTYAWRNFYVAPYLDPFYAGLDPWAGPWVADPFLGNTYGSWPVALPTESMVERALPEGVLMGGGEVSGFLYFPDVPEGTERVTFVAELLNPDTGESLGEIQIPFIPKDA